MENFRKQCHIGIGRYSVWVTIKYQDGSLSINGVESPKTSGNCAGSCGQIEEYLNPLEFTSFAAGWDAFKVAKLKKIWQKWHLNDLQAGSPKQTLFLEVMKEINPPSHGEHYEWACRTLKAAGIYEDESYKVDGKPYRYGTGWLKREVPEKVLKWLASLPDATRPHPWGKTG